MNLQSYDRIRRTSFDGTAPKGRDLTIPMDIGVVIKVSIPQRVRAMKNFRLGHKFGLSGLSRRKFDSGNRFNITAFMFALLLSKEISLGRFEAVYYFFLDYDKIRLVSWRGGQYICGFVIIYSHQWLFWKLYFWTTLNSKPG